MEESRRGRTGRNGDFVREQALALARSQADPAQRLNLLREYLQACVLRSLHESEAFASVAFVGGTALRFLHGLPRFSEDLYFSLESADGYQPVRLPEKMKRDLVAAGFDISMKLNDRKTVHSAWIGFAGLLKPAGLSGMADQKLSIKIEVDTRPPAGAVAATDLVNRHMIFAVRHYDLPSLMAGKIHALVTRRYPKGRDWFDLMWYRAQRPPVEPNLLLLQNALDQTEFAGRFQAAEWRRAARERLDSLDPETLRQDAAPFLERPADARWLDRESLRQVIETREGAP